MKRSKKIEEYLSNECSFDLLRNPSNMNEVDLSNTPISLLEMFYNMGEGNYPSDQSAFFLPPKQDEFAYSFYEYGVENTIDEINFRPETKEAWVQRAKKAWASMVRDVHFAFMMAEIQEHKNSFDSVYYSIKADLENGADLIIKNNNNVYHINLFLDSSKGRKFYNMKKRHRQPNKKAIDVEVPMTFTGPKKSIKNNGEDIWLYSKKHAYAVENIVNTNMTSISEFGDILCNVSKHSASLLDNPTLYAADD